MLSCISLCVDTIPLFEDVLVKCILKKDEFTCTAALRMSRADRPAIMACRKDCPLVASDKLWEYSLLQPLI